MSKVKKGFTLAELLMAMWVMSIILAAVATLSFALGSANDSADNTSDIYSRIRYATMRINELVRNSKLICYNSGTSVTIWRSDDNGNNLINPGEVVSLEIGTSGDSINLVSFQPSAVQADISVPFGLALSASIKGWMAAKAIPSNSVTLVNNCSYVSFTTDEPPPFTEKLNVSFGVKQKGVSRDYQIAAKLRCYADYLLDASGQIDPVDDDI